MEKTFYNIKEASELVGVTRATLRQWEELYQEIAPARSACLRRVYRMEDIRLMQGIDYLIWYGMTHPIKPTKGQKVVTDENGKVRIVPDYEKQRRQKPAGQQFWKKDSVKVKRP